MGKNQNPPIGRPVTPEVEMGMQEYSGKVAVVVAVLEHWIVGGVMDFVM